MLWNLFCYFEATGANAQRKKWNYPNTNMPAAAMNEHLNDINWADVYLVIM